MATQGVMQWSKTAATNATADDAVNWAEGMAPSAVNNSARAEMASVAMWRDDISGTLTTAGTSTAYTLATNATFATAAEMSGALICFIPHTTSGAAPTLAVDGLTARAIRLSTGVNVPTGALIAGTPYTVTYIHASTEFILHGNAAVFDDVTVGDLTATTVTASGAISGTTITGSGAVSGATAAGAMLASQAEQETGTATNKLVTPGRQHFHPGMAKAWGNIQGNNGADLGAYNITSYSRSSTGVYVVTIANDLSSTNYAVMISCFDTTFTTYGFLTTKTAGSFTIQVVDAGGTARDPNTVSFVVFGDL